MADSFERRELPAGCQLVQEGDPLTHLVVVREGEVQSNKAGSSRPVNPPTPRQRPDSAMDGEQQELQWAGKVAYFGEAILGEVERTPRSRATIGVAAPGAVVLSLGGAGLEALRGMLRHLQAERSSHDMQRAAAKVGRDAETALAMHALTTCRELQAATVRFPSHLRHCMASIDQSVNELLSKIFYA